MNKIIFLSIFLLLFSCGKKDKFIITDDEFFSDTIYKRIWISTPNIKNPYFSIEYYVSSAGDTIENQFENYRDDGTIDTLKSEFYDLEIYHTDRPNVYKGIITLHTRFDTLQINEKNSRRLQFMYDEFGDSISLGSVISKTSNRLEFEFKNAKNEHLTGVLIQDVFRDTLVEGEIKLNYGKTRILVDTRNTTDNFFVVSHQFLKEKRINKN